MIINGTNIRTFEAIVTDRSPSRSAAATKSVLAAAPGAWRRVRLGRDAPDALEINLVGFVVAENQSLVTLQSNIDRLKFELRPQREMTIVWSDDVQTPAREFQGFRTLLKIDDIGPGWVTNGVRFQTKIICPVPFAKETAEQTDTDNGTPPRLITPTVGTAPMPVIISITGNASNLVDPVLEYRDGSNNVLFTLAYVGSLTAAQTLVINTEAFTAEVNSVNVGGDMSGTFFDVDPGDGDFLGSPNAPDIRLTATSGIADLFEVKWFRRYW